MPRVLFEPIGEEIDCAEDETVLDAAFRQGLSLVYGCREGQCSACKCYLLEGEVGLKSYSTFALSDTEEAQGYSLLCRAMPDEDLTIELLHYDPDNYKLEHEIQDGTAVVVSSEHVTQDIVRLVLRIVAPNPFDFKPGHYVDLHIPGRGERRSFSLANLPGGDELEFLIKCYPGGLVSGLLDAGVEPGATFGFTGPYGSFYLRDGDGPVLMVAGGSGMAPQLALLRQLVQLGSPRQVRFFYGARTRADLFDLELIEELGAQLPDFGWIPVLSDPGPDDAWDGETGFVHEVAGAHLRAGAIAGDGIGAYLCGPPPMVDAALEMLADEHDFDASQIHYDKFTTTAAADGDA